MKKIIKYKKILKPNKNTTEKGVTLVALVISIIILLILAGITIRDSNRTKWINTKGYTSC